MRKFKAERNVVSEVMNEWQSVRLNASYTVELLDEFQAEIGALKAALESAIRIAEEARQEWDAAPQGMKAGKLLIALSGGCPGYRADIDAIHLALLRAAVRHPSSTEGVSPCPSTH